MQIKFASPPKCRSKSRLDINFWHTLAIGVGLSMDALAISVAAGFSARTVKLHAATRMGLAFGLFQAIMPIAGWLLGLGFRRIIQGVDHWIAFGLLTGVGLKMIYESFRLPAQKKKVQLIGIRMLLLLAIATSLDALAVGLSLSLIGVAIIAPAILIGCVTFSLCFVGVFVGARIGHLFETKLEAVGGVVLIAIGAKILVEHMCS